MMDLRQLQTLVVVSETGSYTAAADILGYTQPAVSYQMRRLQREAGTRLVLQAGRGVRLTPAGEALVMRAQTVFAALRAAKEELVELAVAGGAVVRIVAFQSCCATLIPGVISQISGENAKLRIALHQAEPDEARTRVRRGEDDIGLLANWHNEPLPEGEESMSRVPLIADRRCVVMRRDHPLAAQSEISFVTLAGESWVMESARDRFTTACRQSGFVPRIAATSDDHMTIQTLVMSRLGITLMNELGLYAYTDPGLVARPLKDWPRRSIYALLWPEMASVPAVAAVLRAVETTAGAVRDAIVGADAG